MRPVLLLAAAGLLPAAVGAAEGAKGKKVPYSVHAGYSERLNHCLEDKRKDKTGLESLKALLGFTDQASFDKAFGNAGPRPDLSEFVPNGQPPGTRARLLPKGTFDKKVVGGVTHRGPNAWSYQVERVTADGDTLYVQFKAHSQFGGGRNVLSCPLLVSVDKGKYTSVVFIENGQRLGAAALKPAEGKGP